MRVTPKRKLLETIAMSVYNPVKILVLTDNLCEGRAYKEFFAEMKVWFGTNPSVCYRMSPPRSMSEYLSYQHEHKVVPYFDYSFVRYRRAVKKLFLADPDSIIFQEVFNGYHRGGL